METEFNVNEPWIGTTDWCTFQIGQSRLHINLIKTKEFYSKLTSISENCSCLNCKHFELKVINSENRLFEILNEMNVNLSRQPTSNSCSICCFGETQKGLTSYMGNYLVFGRIGKTTKKARKVDEENFVNQVDFYDSEFGNATQFLLNKLKKTSLALNFI